MEAKESKDERSEKFEQNDIQDHRETLSAAVAEASSLLDDAELVNVTTASDPADEDDPSSQIEARPKTYFEEERVSAWYVIETVLEDVYDILRSHGHYTAAECLRSAYLDFSSSTHWAMDDLRDGKLDEYSRDEVYMDYIRGSNLQEMQEEAADDEVLLRFLLDGINSQLEYVEKNRAKAIEYRCDRLSRSVRGIVYHTCGGND